MSRVSLMEIAQLDSALADAGEDFVLRRVNGVTNQTNVDVTCRGFIRAFGTDELTTNIIQGDTKIIFSPTQIIAAAWPGGPPPTGAAAAQDPRVPRRGDKAIVQGRVMNIQDSSPIYIDNVLVRIELQVRG
jgi:hypothetical protein